LKLDELPQLFNVIKGDMSLVGPRPEIKEWVDAYPDEWAHILRVKPGITDPAALAYRNEEELLSSMPDPESTYREEILPRKLALYRQYIEHRTIWSDIKILLQTVFPFLDRESRIPK
jgi:lipopolysaccharide/colanic/teichoic acid biosynthesis glycosyltransferase